jgi:serine/threonine protein kinase
MQSGESPDQQLPDDYNITDPDHVGTADQQPQQQARVSANPELDALLDQNMDPVRLEAELALEIDEINTAWANGIDLSDAKVTFPSQPKSGSFGTLGFIESDDPNMPKLVIKVPLKKEGTADLQHEADFYKKVGEHPNLCKCKGVVQVDGQRGLVMEAVQGDDMTKSMAKIEDAYKSGKISLQEYWGTVQYMMRETLKGLAALEAAGVVHNDIRSDNIMVDENTGEVKIVDFGVAVNEGERVEKFPRHTGTTSPDIVGQTGRMDGAVTPAHDAFSVGSMTYKAGEGQNFDYNQPGVHFRENRVGAFAAFAPPDQVALRPGDQNTPVATQNPDGTMTKTPGRTGANTDYTRFVNQMMDPDPTKRLSPSKALEDPFLADSPIDDDAARKLIAKLMGKPAQPVADEPSQYSITEAQEEQQQPGNGTQPVTANSGTNSGQTEEEPQHYN